MVVVVVRRPPLPPPLLLLVLMLLLRCCSCCWPSYQVLGADSAEVAISLNNLGVLLERQGQYREAEQLYTQVIQGQDGERSAEMSFALNNLAKLKYEQGKVTEAVRALERAVAIQSALVGELDPSVRNMRGGLQLLRARVSS